MPINKRDQQRLRDAHGYAIEWHADQTRKGSSIPYLSHLVQVQGLVFEFGGSVDQAIAALLHDALEDADSPPERAEREAIVRQCFGEAVLSIVLSCTDTGPDESLANKAPWHERKQRYLVQLAHADAQTALVAGCDKLHNLRCLVSDLRHHGLATLDRFNAGPQDQLWYLRAVGETLADRIPAALATELGELTKNFADLIGEPSTQAGK